MGGSRCTPTRVLQLGFCGYFVPLNFHQSAVFFFKLLFAADILCCYCFLHMYKGPLQKRNESIGISLVARSGTSTKRL